MSVTPTIVSNEVLGSRLASFNLTPSVRDVLAYAAGCGETRSEFLDDTAQGFSALPTQCVSHEFRFISSDAIKALGIKRTPNLVGFHAYQDSQFLHPIEIGIELTLTGSIHGLKRTSVGCLVTYLFEARRSDTGKDVYRSLASILMRGIELDVPEKGESEWSCPVLNNTDTLSTTFTLPTNAAHIYTECAQVWNPMHTEMSAAKRAGLKQPIMQGVASWAITAREIRDAIPAIRNLPLNSVSRLRGRFRAPVIAGTPLTLSGTYETSSSALRLAFKLLNHEDVEAISDGYIEFDLPAD